MVTIDMDMPKTCGECRISYVDYYVSNAPLVCPLLDCPNWVFANEKDADCPLKSIKQKMKSEGQA